MTTHYVADGDIVRHRKGSHLQRRRFGASPTTFAFLAGVGIGKFLSWMLIPKRENAVVKRLREQVELSKRVTVVAEGSWGGVGGKQFYDGGGEIVGIKLYYDDNAVVKLQVTYEQSGPRFQASAHGGAGGELVQISLAYPKEFLMQVVGTYASHPTHSMEDHKPENFS